MEKKQFNVAIFASGSGTNAVNIIEYFRKSDLEVRFKLLCNKKDAPVLSKMKALDVPTFTFSKSDFHDSPTIEQYLEDFQPNLLVLAGFLWLVPQRLIEEYTNAIVNIHPSLLPKYGGRGMYGMKVHEAVIQSGDVKSGITIHYVNEKYDDGECILQAECDVHENDTPEQLANRIHALEYKHYPLMIEKLLIAHSEGHDL